jgi:hypothetical protein
MESNLHSWCSDLGVPGCPPLEGPRPTLKALDATFGLRAQKTAWNTFCEKKGFIQMLGEVATIESC